MKYRYLALAAAAVCESRVYNRQGVENSTSASTSPSTSTNGLLSTTSAVLPSTTPATNGTRSISSVTTTPAPKNETNGCCYIYPRGVGINTWWTSSVDVTVATVITTWLQYNNTIVPGNVTTKTVVNATDFFGAHRVQSLDYTLQPVSATATSTDWICGGWAPYSSGTAPCTSTIWTTRTLSAASTVYYNTSDVLSGVPNSLLPANAVLYGETLIDSTTAATFPSQSLVIEAPTPYYLFSAIGLFTSTSCMATKTMMDYTSYQMTTINGAATRVSSVYPTATVTDSDGASPINPGGSGNLYLNYTLAKPFPDGDYGSFNFTDWAEGVLIGPPPGTVDAYMFELPDDFPHFLAGIPEIKSEYPDIASCTNFAGDGEPTVHVPVNQLTDTSHVTMTMNGALRSSAGSPKPEPVVTTTTTGGDLPQIVTEIPMIETTADELDTPGSDITPTPVVARPGTTLEAPHESTPPVVFSPVTGQSQDQLATPSSSPNQAHVSATPRIPQIAKPDTVLSTPDTPAQHTTQNVGDIIASVIGLVPESDNAPIVETEDLPSLTYAPGPAITIGGTVVTGNDKTEFVIGDKTLVPGGPAVTDGDNTIELPAEATAIVVNGRTSAIAVPVGAAISIGGYRATPIAAGGAYLLPGDKTLSPGAPGVVLAGTTYSLAENGRSVVANGVTSAVPQPSQGVSSRMTELVMSGVTLLPGHEATISGTTYSLPATGEGIYINGHSSHLSGARPGSPITLPNGVVATNTVVSDVIVGSQTLVPGGSAVTVSGTTYSASGTDVVVVASGRTTTQCLEEVESAIMSKTSSQSPSGSTATPTRAESTPMPASTGGAAAIDHHRHLITAALVLALEVFMI